MKACDAIESWPCLESENPIDSQAFHLSWDATKA